MSAIDIVTKQYAMQTRWFNTVLDSISEEEALYRPNGNANHLRWLAGHLMLIRYNMAVRLGMPAEDISYVDLYVIKDMPPPNAKPLDESFDYPTLADMVPRWNRYSAHMAAALPGLADEQLNTPLQFNLPIGGNTLLDMFGFVAAHEAYHMGQMSLVRKELGHSPMTLR